MTRFNGRQDLKAVQMREKSRRRRRRQDQYGLSSTVFPQTPEPQGEPWFKPVSMPKVPMLLDINKALQKLGLVKG